MNNKDIFNYKKIILIGNNGCGKSYFADKLAQITGLPLIHLDNEYWLPGWDNMQGDDWVKKQQELISGEKWIIDGNYTGTMEIRFKHADLIIFLDVNRITCLLGILKRHGKKRSDFPDYLADKIDRNLFILIRSMWRFPKMRRPSIFALHEKYDKKTFWTIKGRRQMKKLLKKWNE